MPDETEHDIKVIIPAHSTRLMMCLPIDEYNALKARVEELEAYILRNCDPMDMTVEDAKLYHALKGA